MTNGITAGLGAWAMFALPLLCVAQVPVGGGFLSDIIVTVAEDRAEIRLHFNCAGHYLSHTPAARGRELRLHLDTIELCAGEHDAAVLAPETRRVRHGELASLLEVQYEGEAPGGPQLELHFSREVEFVVQAQSNLRELVVAVSTRARSVASETIPVAMPHQAGAAGPPGITAPTVGRYAINLKSANQPFDRLDVASLAALGPYTVYETHTEIAGRSWYRLRLGFFDTETSAKALSDSLKGRYPGLWLVVAATDEVQTAQAAPLLSPRALAERGLATPTLAEAAPAAESEATAIAPAGSLSSDKRSVLLQEGRRALAAGELSKAVQLFTKVSQQGGDAIAETAQELLGVARERNGQIAHAKAVYEQFLQLYPEGEGASRVRQRLAALSASATTSRAQTATSLRPATRSVATQRWDADTSLWQFYRRQVAEVNDESSLLSQSALLSDVDFRIRRRGERLDLESRLALGYWYDFMGEEGSGSESQISNAYLEAVGHEGGWRARLGRQSRSTAGVLGRYDGVHVSYEPRDSLTLNFVSGCPVYSTRDGFDSTRLFEGVSVDLDSVASAWDLSAFYNQQTTAGILDRQAIGAEARYFDEHRSLFTLFDYDVSYGTLNNVYVVGNWRTRGQLTVNATVNKTHSPYLTTSNALVGQPLTSVDELLAIETEEQIRQLALDRTATSTTYSAGLSRPLLQKLQVDMDLTSTSYSATVPSGGVEGFPASDYRYYSVALMGQSLIKEGDMGILTLRIGDTTSYEVMSLSLDGRYPVRGLRVNPRLRVDRRTRFDDGTEEWVYTPMLRMQYQWQRRYYLEFETGMYLSDRKTGDGSDEFQTSFFNLGYRYVF